MICELSQNVYPLHFLEFLPCSTQQALQLEFNILSALAHIRQELSFGATQKTQH